MVEHRKAQEFLKAAKEADRALEEMRKVAAAQRTLQDYKHVLEEIQRAGLDGHFLIGGLPEEMAAEFADESVHRVRKELAREHGDESKAPPPTPEEIEEWKRRRDEQRNEAY